MPHAPTRVAPSAYYYASGKQVRLEAAPGLVAFDTGVLPNLGLTDAARSSLLTVSRTLRGDLALADSGAVPAGVIVKLEEAGALRPVYRFGPDLVVVLPEVRVEESRPERREKIDAWIKGVGDTLSASETNSGRLTLRPVSGRGEDALQIANELHEGIGPELAQARFVRVVARPDAARSRPRR